MESQPVFQGRTENFDDYYQGIRNEYSLFHMYNWIQFFVYVYDDTVSKKNYYINKLNKRGEYILK